MTELTVLHPEAIDEILGKYRGVLGLDAATYRNHVLRGLNYQALLLGRTPPATAVLAWAVHDLGIWTAGTFDYLEPSVALIDRHAADLGIGDVASVRAMVLEHHRLRPVHDPVVETFRRADLVDVSHGLIRSGLRRAQIRDVVSAFPYLGFHRWLAAGLTRYALHHPTAPAPMIRL